MDIFGTAVTSLQLISDVRKKVKEYKKIFEALDKLQKTLIELQELRANVESLPVCNLYFPFPFSILYLRN
jgi:hypothetical protein